MRIFTYIFLFLPYTFFAQCWDTTRVPLKPAVDLIDNYGCVSAFEDGTTYYFDDYSGYVYKSTDFARSFSYVGTPPVKNTQKIYNRMAFSSKNIGWIMMDRMLFKSEDGGKTWFKKADFTNVPNNGDPQFIHIYTDSIFWVFSDDYNKRTTDGGNTWKKLLSRDLIGFAHQSPDTMFIPDFWNGQKYYLSVDTGNTTKPIPFIKDLRYFRFLNKNYGYAVVMDSFNEVLLNYDTTGGVFFTRDGGKSWSKQSRITDNQLFAKYGEIASEIIFADSLHGIYDATKLTIHKTNDGGRTWKKQKRFPARFLNSVSTILRNQTSYPHKDFAVTIAEKGLILRYQTPPPPTCNFPKVIDTLKVGEPIKWYPPAGCVGGYVLRVGTSSGAGDIIDSLDIGDTLQWYPSKALPFGKTIYVSIRPYNDGGFAPVCKSYDIPTLSCTLETRIDTLIKLGGSYKGIVYQTDTTLIESYKSKLGCDSIIQTSIDVLTTNQELLADSPTLTVNPNPALDHIQIEVKHLNPNKSTYLLFSDAVGRKLQKLPIDGNYFSGTFNLANYPNGVYLLKLFSDKITLATEKIVIMK